MVESSPRQRQLPELWMQAQPTVYRFVCTAVARRHDAEDVVQQVALEVANSFGNYDKSRPFLPWVLTIARRMVIRFYEQRKREHVIFSDAALELLADYHARPSRVEDAQDALQQCVQRLDEKSRRILAMRYDAELTTTELAERSGLTRGSVRVTLSRIRKQLADCVRGKLAGRVA